LRHGGVPEGRFARSYALAPRERNRGPSIIGFDRLFRCIAGEAALAEAAASIPQSRSN
jgi:hypothetical protein